MLNKTDADNLYKEIKIEQNKAMKGILNHASFALDKDKFELFRKIVFNSFGKSGLESAIDNIIEKYTDKQ